MKLVVFLACLSFFVAYTQAQCLGAVPNNRVLCTGGRNEGDGRKISCRWNANGKMWFFDKSDMTCKTLVYRGCGGNSNRFCRRADCEARCKASLYRWI